MIHSRPRVPRPIRRSASAIAVTAVLALAACGSDSTDAEDDSADIEVTDERDGDTRTEAETTTTTATTTLALGGAGGAGTDATTTTTAPPTTVAATTTTTTTTTPPGPADCLVGQWRLRSQEFLDEIVSSLPAEATGGLSDWTHVGGEYLIDINDDGTTRGQRLAWTHRLATPEGALVTTIDSDDPGTYTVDGTMISVTDDASDATVSVGIEIGGAVQPIPGGTQQLGTDGISGSGTFECDGDVLTIMLTDLPDAPPGGFTATLDRV